MTMIRELCDFKDAQYDRNLRISHMFEETILCTKNESLDFRIWPPKRYMYAC